MNNNSFNSEVDNTSLQSQTSSNQTKDAKDADRNKYQTKYNIYHDKDKLNKDSMIVLWIILIIVVLIILAIIF